MTRKAFSDMKKYCIVCGREFRIYINFARNNKKSAVRRSKKSVTCSKNCSRLYTFRSMYNKTIDHKLEKLMNSRRTN